MENPEFEKSKIYTIAELADYMPHTVVVKHILKRATGTVKAVLMDAGEQLAETISRFDHFIQIIEGKAEVFIDDHSFNLASGEFIIIPANSRNTIIANEKSKIISTIIKSGYE